MSRLKVRKYLPPNLLNENGEIKIRSPPEYFERIRESAAKRWDQLEKDPGLAAPWHQLFKQVQNPRHVLSELLQNADDARATKASARIEDGVFIFEHNGEDFTEEHFASICSFGYSNKRSLPTIGFRGIGFKSAFSLGDTVELSTPTLSVAFSRNRFTVPIWIDGSLREDGRTQVRVKIQDQLRQCEVDKNLKEWLSSPLSLLFFIHIRHIKIKGNEVHWQVLGTGPVMNTKWVKLAGKDEQPFLLARSAPEPFPEDALSEVKEERLIAVDKDIDSLSCRVEIVIGAKGKLFAVLPTGVETTLPFACNGPFIQDPARMKIKDPEISPTNRWLLERIGKLATSVMLQWLKNDRINLAERSKAYSILPDADRNDSSLEGACVAIVGKTFDVIHEDKACLLTNEGTLTPANKSIIIPRQILNVWHADQVSTLFDDENRPVFSLHVSDADRKKLIRWNIIKEIDKKRVLSILQSKRLPKPESWERLLNLWAYVAPEITGYAYPERRSNMRIVPVLGKEALYSASEIVRLGEKKLLQSDEDWKFLSTYLLVLNNDWFQFLRDLQQSVQESKETLKNKVNSAYSILHAIGLENSSDTSKMIEQAAIGFFNQKQLKLHDCVRFAQIAAKLRATVRTTFRYVTQDRYRRDIGHIILFDEDGNLKDLFPSDWSSIHLLHADYSTFNSCTKEEWNQWISSGHAGIYKFVPPAQKKLEIRGRQDIKREISARGHKGEIKLDNYATEDFRIEDWDFEEAHWKHWQFLAESDDKLWGHLVELILAQPKTFWLNARNAKAVHIYRIDIMKTIASDLTPNWILKLRDLPCLQDTRGVYRKPTDLFRMTPETVPFLDVEPFINTKFDNESTRELLDLLGVCNTPTGPDRILDRLRALSKTEKPPIHEVDKWYSRLDLIVNNCSTADLLNIKKAFEGEKIIFTEKGNWVQATDVFLRSDDEDVPGVAIVRDSVKDLTLWRKIGIPERPTVDHAIKWLKELPVGENLLPEDIRRVRALLVRHSFRIWDECGQWLNLAGEWVPIETISYALTKQSHVPWNHLYKWVKQKTADLRLPPAITQAPPFSEIPTLVSQIEERFNQTSSFTGHLEKKPWLNLLGLELCRIVLDDENNTARIRLLAADLANTKWQTVRGLETIPYLKGTQAGTSRRANVLWFDKTLYVDDLPNAKLARQVPDELGKDFDHPDIIAALNYCFGRSLEEITEYLEENFKLLEKEKVETPILKYTIPVDEEIPQKEQELQVKQINVPCLNNPLKPAADLKEDKKEATSEESPLGEEITERAEKDRKAGDINNEIKPTSKIMVTPSREHHLPKPAKQSTINTPEANVLQDIEDFKVTYIGSTETEREINSISRIGQDIFRSGLKNYWKKCAVTGCELPDLLIASHIKPWRYSNNTERLDIYNGLLLIPNLDSAFGKGYISFDNEGKIIISNLLTDKDKNKLGINSKMELRKIEKNHIKYLDYHRQKIFKN